MKLLFKAVQRGPLSHKIDGENINGINLSPLGHGDKFIGGAFTAEAGIEAAHRDEAGELHVVLTERVIASQLPARPAHWRGGSEEIDAEDYSKDVCHVVPTGVSHLVHGVDYRIAWGNSLADGAEGWTITQAGA